MTDPGGIFFERIAQTSDAGLRLDQFWARELAAQGVSRERAKDWIRDGLAAIDGRACAKPNTRLAGVERLTLRAPQGLGDWQAGVRPEPGALDVVHADDSVAVLDKPAGLTVHPAPGLSGGTLVHRLLSRFPALAALMTDTDRFRPGIVHRLDKDTSGLIVVALTEKARLALARDFASRQVDKTYLAVVRGRPSRIEGEIDAPIGRHPTQKTKMAVVEKGGRPARTGFRVLWTEPRGRASLLALSLFTGRTHQIRVHMAHLGHPLLGDAAYGPGRSAWPGPGLAPRQMLHAFRLAFAHPGTGERMIFFRPPPADFLGLLLALAGTCLRVGIVGLPGSGKSTLLRILEERGEACFSADAAVARLYAPGQDGARWLAARFGGRFIGPDGGADRAALFAAMAASGSLRREIVDLVHPLVEHALLEFWSAQASRPRAFAEVPLLLEGGWHKKGLVDLVAGVHCPDSLRLGALRQGRGIAPERQAVFDSWQWPMREKLGQCQLVVENPGDVAGLARRAEALLRALDSISGSRRERFAAWLSALWQRLGREGA